MKIKTNTYGAFTLVEMLIVMGILIILMVIGITAGRFAINRANDVAHQNAADQIYQGLQAYYTDNRAFPTGATVEEMLVADGDLYKYLDSGAFKGGTEASYFYFVGGMNGDQAVLVCVSLRGNAAANDDRDDGSYYCNGNGFGVTEDFAPSITNKNSVNGDAGTGADYAAILLAGESTTPSDWNGNAWE
ncbi:MAG: type II secretion system protein [Candidatus Dojkabacteria bacterium]